MSQFLVVSGYLVDLKNLNIQFDFVARDTRTEGYSQSKKKSNEFPCASLAMYRINNFKLFSNDKVSFSNDNGDELIISVSKSNENFYCEFYFYSNSSFFTFRAIWNDVEQYLLEIINELKSKQKRRR
jgi:hypothetical protein